ARLGDERWPYKLLECRLVDTRGERRLERILQRAFMAIEPVDDALQRQPRINASSPRIGMRRTFRPRREVMNLGKFCAQEGELGHGYSAARVSSIFKLFFSELNNPPCNERKV